MALISWIKVFPRLLAILASMTDHPHSGSCPRRTPRAKRELDWSDDERPYQHPSARSRNVSWWRARLWLFVSCSQPRGSLGLCVIAVFLLSLACFTLVRSDDVHRCYYKSDLSHAENYFEPVSCTFAPGSSRNSGGESIHATPSALEL